MKRFIKYSLLFFSIPAILLIAYYFSLKAYLDAINYDINNLYSYNYSWIKKLEAPPRILLMGSSTVRYGLSPTIISDELNIPKSGVVNLAHNARTPIQSYYLLKTNDYPCLDSLDAVFYGIDSWVFSKKYYKHDVRLMFDLDLDELVVSLYRGYFNIHSILGIDYLKLLVIGGNTKPYSLKAVPADYGASKLTKRPINFQGSIEEWYDYENFSFSQLQFYYLRKIKDHFEERGIKFILLNLPRSSAWHREYVRDCQGLDHAYNALMDEYLGEFKSIGSTTDIPCEIESELFNDGVHLNEKGQVYYSKLFCTMIQNLNLSRDELKYTRAY